MRRPEASQELTEYKHESIERSSAKDLDGTWPDLEHLKVETTLAAAFAPSEDPPPQASSAAVDPAVDVAIHRALSDQDAGRLAAYLEAEGLGDLASLTMLDEIGWREVSAKSGLGAMKVAKVMRAVADANWGPRPSFGGRAGQLAGRCCGPVPDVLLCGKQRALSSKS